MTEGSTLEEARERIWMQDIDGLLAKGRPEGKLGGHKWYYAKEHEVMKDFAAVVKEVRPSILIGASAAGGAFTPEILQSMGEFNERPIIFALSNPTSRAECTAQAAYDNTKGRCIFSSGSPFGPVEYEGKTFYPGQGNNAYIFPGVALGVIATGTHHIPEDMFLIAAETIAKYVTDEDIQRGSLYPPLSLIRECSFDIAIGISKYAYAKGELDCLRFLRVFYFLFTLRSRIAVSRTKRQEVLVEGAHLQLQLRELDASHLGMARNATHHNSPSRTFDYPRCQSQGLKHRRC